MPRRLRVLRISHSDNVSAYRERDRALTQVGEIDLALICPASWSHMGGLPEDIEESFTVERARTILTGSVPLFAYDPIPIAKLMRSFLPDIVDIHEEPYSVSGFQIAFLASRYAPRARLVFYSAQNIKKQYPFPFSQSEKFVYRRSSGAYPCSEGVREVLLAKGFHKPCPVIPLGVDPRQFSPHIAPLPLPNKDSSFNVGYCGRLEPCKGVELLLRALSILQSRLAKTDRQIRLVIAGGGSQERALKVLAQNLGVVDLITWLGELNLERMANFYRSCDVLVVPSITTPTWREQFGRVPVEAMSCGTPVIVSNSGSLPEVVRNGAGVVIPENDHISIAKSVERLFFYPAEAANYSRDGISAVHEHYSWERVAQMQRALYFQTMTDGCSAVPVKFTK